jgi:hypothetical protein
MIIKAEAGKTGIITATDDSGRIYEILIDQGGRAVIGKTNTWFVPLDANANAEQGHIVEIFLDHPPGDVLRVPHRVRVECPHTQKVDRQDRD